MKNTLFILSAAASLAFAGCRTQNDDVQAVRRFIRDNWHTTVQHCTADTATLIGLPSPYTVPTAGPMFREMYYWDTFFTNEGLIRDGHPELAKGNTDNLVYLVRRFGKVYNGSRTYYEARSQPPYLSMMVDRIYRSTGDREWLAAACETLKEEYAFWMRERLTPVGLNRYGSSAREELVDEFLATGGKRLGRDFFNEGRSPEQLRKLGLDLVAEAESGWDFNPRFDRRCTDFCPLDLNANLYQYEVNFARFARELGRDEEARQWLEKAARRRELLIEYCYDPSKKQFYDYDYVNSRRSDVLSGAVFALLYAGAVPQEYAPGIVRGLERLEFAYGIAACENKPYDYPYQWSYPNTWPPVCFYTVFGLARYGFDAEAERIASKWMKAVTKSFSATGNLWEKYNVETGTTEVSNEYEMPAMLGWTAGTFICLDDYLAGEMQPDPLPAEPENQ